MKILYYTGWTLTRVISKLVFRIRVTGHEHFPTSGGFILATNHRSNFDPLLAGSWAPRQVYFFAKQELFRNKLFGWVITRTNALPVRRGTVDRHALELTAKVISDGFGLTIFPEGTRSKTEEFLEPKPGVGMMAIRSGCPIVPGYIHGSSKLKDCFLGRRKMSITYGEAIPAEWVTAQPPSKDGYMAVTQEVMRRIGALRDGVLGIKR
ncbi:MAG TPA: lysophospholipid acyltransferase family protein [candidate division Zixibacteria bacterium]|nr:lysophospholipid acyltransferase family protein [candidate division Zixibacteria bacterium]